MLKVVREKIYVYITFKGAKIRFKSDFLIQTMESRRQWNVIFKVLKEHNSQPKILCSQNIHQKRM